MKKRTSVFARLFALLAIIAALAAVYVAVSGALDEDSSKNGKQSNQHAKTEKEEKPKITAATYEVEEGDTLTRISHLTGVKVTRIIELNPETDPQGLVIGEVLKLR
ncbi:MAG TPA: LysM domain-containing protein [Solirubrobacterales bacterium]|nr:LysM domain-containing protein [Solirubrobacterales bacterium]